MCAFVTIRDTCTCRYFYGTISGKINFRHFLFIQGVPKNIMDKHLPAWLTGFSIEPRIVNGVQQKSVKLSFAFQIQQLADIYDPVTGQYVLSLS